MARVYRIAWTTERGFMSRSLKSDRSHEVKVLGEGRLRDQKVGVLMWYASQACKILL